MEVCGYAPSFTADISTTFDIFVIRLRCYDDFEEKVNSRGEHWDDNINLWQGYDWEEYGDEMLANCCYDIPEEIKDFIDLERYGRYCGEEYLQEYSDGLIEIQ